MSDWEFGSRHHVLEAEKKERKEGKGRNFKCPLLDREAMGKKLSSTTKGGFKI